MSFYIYVLLCTVCWDEFHVMHFKSINIIIIIIIKTDAFLSNREINIVAWHILLTVISLTSTDPI